MAVAAIPRFAARPYPRLACGSMTATSGCRACSVAIEPSVVQIVDTIKDTIEETPPELVADIMDQGIVLAGGGGKVEQKLQPGSAGDGAVAVELLRRSGHDGQRHARRDCFDARRLQRERVRSQ